MNFLSFCMFEVFNFLCLNFWVFVCSNFWGFVCSYVHNLECLQLKDQNFLIYAIVWANKIYCMSILVSIMWYMPACVINMCYMLVLCNICLPASVICIICHNYVIYACVHHQYVIYVSNMYNISVLCNMCQHHVIYVSIM